MKISPARTAAFDVLYRIETEGSYSSVLLPQVESGLSAADRGLCHQLTLGTLREQIYLDRVIAVLSSGKTLDPAVRIALRLGLYQLKTLEKIPEHAAINESVNLVQRARKTSAKGFVNAILRRYLREGVELTFESESERLSAEGSHPQWLVERWIRDLGETDAAELVAANNRRPAVAFRVSSDADADVERLTSDSIPSKFAAGCYLADGFDAELIALASSGKIYLQDEASQIAANAVPISPGGRFLDVCASPGGKTTLIGRKNLGKPSLIVAGDIHWPRIEILRENMLKQLGAAGNIIQYDAETALPFAEESFDSVFVDAPCSGTGTIRHNPELRYLVTAQDLEQLPAKQLAILTNASKLVSVGGTIVYSTCSIEPEENEQVCDEFLRRSPAFVKVFPEVDGRFKTRDGYARTWPQRDNMDGFFIAAFRRR